MQKTRDIFISSVPTVPADTYYVSATVSQFNVQFLIDTGSPVSLLSRETWKELSLSTSQTLETWCGQSLVGVDGSPLNIVGHTTLTLTLNEVNCIAHFIVVDMTVEGILGIDFMKKHHCNIDISNKSLFFSQEKISIPLFSSADSQECTVHLAKTVQLPGRCEKEVLAITKSPLLGKNNIWLLEQTPLRKNTILVARAVVDPHSGYFPVRLLNFGDETVTLHENTKLGSLQTADIQVSTLSLKQGDRPTPKALSNEKYHILQQLVNTSADHLSAEEKQMFLAFLVQYADCFAFPGDDLGRTSKLRHTINTGNNAPVRQPIRRLPPIQRKEVQTLIDDMLAKGIIQESCSPWASPIVLVTKKDGTTRFCVDYRKVNTLTQKDAYPLPRIDETLDALSGSQLFSTLDLASGYWQVEVEKNDRPKTAFCTTEGLFEFQVMPFGLCNAPATFQRLMNLILSGLQWNCCLVYLDDIIVHGNNFQEHLYNLDLVFSRIQKARLKIKPTKCAFFKEKVKYLGHIVSKEGVAADPEKTVKVKTWPVPSSVKEVQQFLGLANYYRRFIRDFASIAKPLHKLTEKNSSFSWTKECQQSFETLREKLSSPPVLCYPNFEESFILDTDASNDGIGAVLSQCDAEGKEHVVAYASRLLSKAERNYCVTRRELLAVVTFLSYFRPYLLGRTLLDN